VIGGGLIYFYEGTKEEVVAFSRIKDMTNSEVLFFQNPLRKKTLVGFQNKRGDQRWSIF
jgi:hypothetical protein